MNSTSNKPNVNYLLKQASKFEKDGSLERAKNKFKQVLSVYPKNKTALKALKEIETKLIHIPIKHPQKNTVIKLWNLLERGQLDIAVAKAKDLIKKFPDSYILWHILGAAYFSRNNLTDAKNAYDNVLELQPDFAEGYNNLGSVLFRLGNLDRAVQVLEQAIILKQDYAEALNNLGLVYYKKNKYERAFRYFTQATILRQNVSEYQLNLGNSLLNQGKLDEALVKYSRAIMLDPKCVDAYCNIAIIFHERSNFPESLRNFNFALSIQPNHFASAYNISKFPTGLLSNDIKQSLTNFFDINAERQNNLKKFLFFEGNFHRHMNNNELAFSKFVEANRTAAQENVKQLEEDKKSRENFKKVVLSNTLACEKSVYHSIKIAFILGPSRSGKSSLEKLLCKNKDTFPMYEYTKLRDPGYMDAINNKNRKNLTFEDIFFYKESDLKSKGYTLVTCTAPGTLRAIINIAKYLPNAFFIFLERDVNELAAEIFITDYEHRNYYAYSPEAIYDYLDWYSYLTKIVISKIPNRSIGIDFEVLSNDPNKIISEVGKFLSVDLSIQPNKKVKKSTEKFVSFSTLFLDYVKKLA